MFKTAHKMFTKHPSSAHWTALSSAMLVHQQWFQIKTMRGGALLSPTLDAMDDLPVSAWGEGIVKSALGMSIAEALA